MSRQLVKSIKSIAKVFPCYKELKILRIKLSGVASANKTMYGLVYNIRGLQNLKHLNLDLLTATTAHNAAFLGYLGSTVAKLEKLESLKFVGETAVKHADIEVFGELISRAQSLKSLTFSFRNTMISARTRVQPNIQNPPFYELSAFVTNLSLLKDLRHLSLLNIVKSISDPILDSLYEALPLLVSLQSLSLHLIGNQDFKNMKLAVKAFSSLPSLASLKFTILTADSKILNDTDFSQFTTAIATVEQLKELDFTITTDSSTGCTNCNLYNIISPLSWMKNLKRLSFIVTHPKIAMLQLPETIYTVFKLPKIESFTILRYCYTKDKASLLEKLIETPEICKTIEDLDFKFSSNETKFVLLMKTLENNSNFPSLKNLTMELITSPIIANEDFKKILGIINKNSPIETINFNISRCTAIREDAMILLSHRLLLLKNLRELKLLISPSSLSDEIEIFGNNLSKLTGLTSIVLAFECSKDVTNYCLAHIYKMVGKIQTLRNIEISQSKFNLISLFWTDMCDSLISLQNLTHLNLAFSDCLGLTESGLEKFSGALKKLKNLESLKFKFDTRGNVGSINKFLTALEDLQGLKTLYLNIVEKKPEAIGNNLTSEKLKKTVPDVMIHINIAQENIKEQPIANMAESPGTDDDTDEEEIY